MKTCSIIDYFSRPWFALVLILLIGFLAYSNIYQVPFVFDGVLQIEDKATIKGGPADWTNFVHTPGKGHCAMPAHPSKGGTESGDTASCRR